MNVPPNVQLFLLDLLVHGGPPVIALATIGFWLLATGRLRWGREIEREVEARVSAEKERDLAREEARGYRERLDSRQSTLSDALALLELVRGRVDFEPTPRSPRTPVRPKKPRPQT